MGGLVRGARRVEVARRRRGDRAPRRGMENRAAAAADRARSQRAGGRAIVTGEQRYPSDVVRPGMLHGVVLRPPAAGAELRPIDLGDAPSPGVTIAHEGSFVGVAAATPVAARGALE